MNDETKPQKNRRTRSQEAPNPPQARLRPTIGSSNANESRLKSAPPPNSIRDYRRRAGLSLARLGRLLGVTGETIRRLEERDTWLDAERAAEIGKALGVPKEVLGFSDTPDAYAWAAKAIPVIGSVIADDQVRYCTTGRRVAGGSHLPSDAVALDIIHGKLRGWMLFYREGFREPMSKEVLKRQGLAEKFIVNLRNGTTWWRNIKPASERHIFHLNSPYLQSVNDVEISWVSEILALQVPLFNLPIGVSGKK
ncbi:helix-turn-helix transcriptional regulator [Bradyrhizobium sp. CCBAU 11386]|uniref:helix-turn-helix transcriptional regulator n=1 Tax=Bradyrhizobium sp. CCBAU 11386 TaxID=1630837 RepID=UPI002304BAD6|nr:helix-turn-helix transcriptional regulator [Bradyrhizobium sp. CCBAU 11386]